jgi:DNA transformation protein and related proteins
MKILRPAQTKPPQLKNLGPVSTGWLASVGIRRRADLIRMGPVEAFLRVKAAGHKPSLNLLWALAGAERGLRWNKLSEQDRHALLLELDAAQARKGTPRKS